MREGMKTLVNRLFIAIVGGHIQFVMQFRARSEGTAQ
jgi:hypothetical protein